MTTVVDGNGRLGSVRLGERRAATEPGMFLGTQASFLVGDGCARMPGERGARVLLGIRTVTVP
ncbi:hypothetical protein XF36_05575 [Pseudonocardia sp. HH130629-09]|nr:hypothetical protein XF36_05575 [Pseudonocardia sp. HH130629-09]